MSNEYYYKDENLSKEEKNWTAIMHLSLLSGFIIPFAGLIIPIIIWISKRDSSNFLNTQGKEVLNLLITLAIAGIAASLLSFIFIGFILMIPVLFYAFIMPIIAAIKCSEGIYYKYPYILRLVK
ncbi:MAG: DUF4870 domain-containing protein [Oligoflexia bacterium]|nr:DUF4870 domain-containing protein [Oligoflexia bacterium]